MDKKFVTRLWEAAITIFFVIGTSYTIYDHYHSKPIQLADSPKVSSDASNVPDDPKQKGVILQTDQPSLPLQNSHFKDNSSGDHANTPIVSKELFLNNIPKSDVSILIIDNNNNTLNSISSEISKIYKSKGLSVSISLFTNNFIHSQYVNDLKDANSDVIKLLSLSDYANYIVIGKYSNEFDEGEYTKYISRANLDVTVISCLSKSLIDGFKVSASNGFDDKENAEKGVIEKLVRDFEENHVNNNNQIKL